MSQTRAQQRARHALEEVLKAAEDTDVDGGRFRSYTNSLPAMIQMNGLGQAAAFCRSKTKSQTEYLRLYNILSSWLTGQEQPYFDKDDLLKGITEKGMKSYRDAQAEALAYLDWVKRFAQAYVVVREDQQDQEPSEAPVEGGAP